MSDISQVEQIFLNAIAQQDPAERAAYLNAACGPDAELRRRVEVLLAAQPHARGFLEPPADLNRTGAYQARTSNPEPTAAVGDRVGPYTLSEVIGEGGMGTVWRAKQTEPVKRFVALKLIKPGMDSKQVLARFDAERQALAMMDHPNIAKILDGGIHDNRPFFVMELVKGTPITEFCDARKLTPHQRLELFLPVCQAIQHAHQKGIIHRDIKPSNVLIALYDDKPVPKVIDFGVAKATGGALTQHTIDTGFGGVVGTPQYMSPEQATFNNLDIDTRSDVYSLGTLLYELLAGSPPFARPELEKRGLLEILRVVREEEPPRPSVKLSTADAKASISANRSSEPAKLSALMKGEIDWIVMKALEKDRTRRYDTANGLAKDIQRYLNGDAVEACPPTLGYRLRKAYRRNKTAVRVAGAFFCLALVALWMGAYVLQQRFARQSATEQAVNESLSKATLLRGQAQAAPVGDLTRWMEAIAAAKQAEASLQTGEPSDALRQRVAELIQTLESEQSEAAKLGIEAEKDRKLFARIEAIRAQFVDADNVRFQSDRKSAIAADEAYAAALREFGVDVDQVEPAVAGRLLRQHSRPLEIAFTIDAWALIRRELAIDSKTSSMDVEKDWRSQRLVELAKIIDDDRWRCAIRNKIESPNHYEILKLLENEQDLSKQPARWLYILALMLRTSDEERYFRTLPLSTAPVAMLKRAWQLSPNDFQICWTLSQLCPDELEKRAFAMAAVAAAPESEFAKKWSLTTEVATDSEPLLTRLELVKKGDKATEWKSPHVVIESSLGEKVLIGPTRYPALTDDKKKTLDREVQELRWAIRLQPTVTALQMQLSKRLVRLGSFKEALATFEATTKLKGKLDPEETIAEELYGMGQLDKAKELLEAMIRQGETRYLNEVYALLGVIHTEQGLQVKAFECFRNAYRRVYRDEEYGSITRTLNDWEKVMQCSGTTGQVVAAYRKLASPKELGAYLVKQGKPEEAVKVYREALTRKDGDQVLYELSGLLVQLMRPEEAIELYRQAIAKNPKDTDLRKSLADLYGKTGKRAERIAVLNELVTLYLEQIKTEPNKTYMNRRLADVYWSLGKKDEARKHYREWIKTTPSTLMLNGFAMNLAANYDPKDRDGELAVAAATKACELTGYGNSTILDTLATAYAQKGDFDAAVKWQLKAIELLDGSESREEREEYEKNLKLFREKKSVPPYRPTPELAPPPRVKK